ncbi:MAG: alpha/beta fold hydrolase, partial [Rhodanobacteraceae bacterium]
WNVEASARALAAPALLLQGVDDQYGTLAQIETIRSAATRARVDSLILAQCAHAPHLDRPQTTLAAITAFVGEFAAY